MKIAENLSESARKAVMIELMLRIGQSINLPKKGTESRLKSGQKIVDLIL